MLVGGLKSLSKVLHKIGFKWSRDGPRRGFMEPSDIDFKRIQFLPRYVEIKQQNLYQFVFTDGTWIFQNGTLDHSWQDKSKHSVKSTKVYGKRLVTSKTFVCLNSVLLKLFSKTFVKF